MTDRFDPENIDRLFSNGLQGFTATPHAHVWESVRRDVPMRRPVAIWRWAAAAAILLAFGGGMFTQSLLYKHGNKEVAVATGVGATQKQGATQSANPTTPITRNTASSNANIQSEYDHNSAVASGSQNNDNQSVSYYNRTSNKNKGTVLPTSKNDVGNRVIPPVEGVTNLQPKADIIPVEPQKSIDSDVMSGLSTQDFSYINPGLNLENNAPITYHNAIVGVLPPPVHRSHFYIGTNASFNHVSIIDRKNLNNSYQFQFVKTLGVAQGVQAGWNITKHWGIEARFTIHSYQGQRYSYRVNEKYMPEREIRLDYYYFPLMVKYQTRLTSYANLVAMGGFQYGKYRSNDAFEYNQATSQLKHFRPNDAGSILAAGIDVPLSRHILLGLYSNAYYGSDLGASSLVPSTPKLVVGGTANRQSSDDFSHPHNLVYGLNMALSYRF